jgi:glutathione-independent formaldehyde dehydrogenase
LKGASEVYVVDNIAERLHIAKEMGAIPIDFGQGDPVERIFEIRRKRQGIQQSRRPGEEKLQGVDCAIDAVGYQARDDKDPSQENPTQALENALRVVNPTGSVGIIGVYISPDPGAKDEQRKKGIFSFPLADFFEKGLTVGTGQAPVKKYNEYLRDLIICGRAKPSKIVSHHINIEQAPDAYSKFDRRIEGYTKVLIRFGEKAAA